MRGPGFFKTIQCLIYIAIAGVCVYLILFATPTYRLMEDVNELKMVCAMVWGILVISFVFLFIDFSMMARQRKMFENLDFAANSDPHTGIANRQGLDEVIAGYNGKELPENVSCIMIILTSLYKLNEQQQRDKGDKQVRDFSTILHLAAVEMGTIGRNGGNVFMCISEGVSEERIKEFIERMNELVDNHNYRYPDSVMEYKCGYAHNKIENVNNINKLISIANERARA